jgi:hypothetical protein
LKREVERTDDDGNTILIKLDFWRKWIFARIDGEVG